ncbi:unnamed protein product [Chrysoparadoxa australica]
MTQPGGVKERERGQSPMRVLTGALRVRAMLTLMGLTAEWRSPPMPEVSSSKAAVNRRGFLGLAFGAGAALMQPLSAEALFEDVQKPGGCPAYEDIKGKSMENFDLDLYMGIWHEWAYHDWTQFEMCGCTRNNLTRIDSQHIEDIFTSKCPKVTLPSVHPNGHTWAVNGTLSYGTPGMMHESTLGGNWPNMILEVWPGASPSAPYQKAIQMQCIDSNPLGLNAVVAPTPGSHRSFVGINFFSRKPVPEPGELEEMFDRAAELGLVPYGGTKDEMVVVEHATCAYPSTTDNALVTARSKVNLGQPLGVRILDDSLLLATAVR